MKDLTEAQQAVAAKADAGLAEWHTRSRIEPDVIVVNPADLWPDLTIWGIPVRFDTEQEPGVVVLEREP